MKSGTVISYSKKKQSDKWIDNQIFGFIYDNKTGFYKIRNVATGLDLDVERIGTADDSTVGVHSTNSGCNQLWKISETKGEYSIISACSDKYLSVSKTKKSNSRPQIVISSEKTSWKLDEFKDERLKEDRDYQIILEDESKAIDISGGVDKNTKRGEAVVYKKKDSDTDNQTFRVKYFYSSGYYAIYNPVSNLYLDVAGMGEADDSKIILHPYNGGCNQLWTIEKDANGSYTISSACSSKGIVVSTEKYGSCPRITIYNKSKKIQKWMFEEL